MNKLMGFLELKEMRIPSIQWEKYEMSKRLDDKYLWTIRSAVYRGDDLNLPRLVGENAANSQEFANKLLKQLGDRGMVICYPYFIAKKSGTLEVKRNKVIIEAVKKDLWNLVSFSDREVTILVDEKGEMEFMGNREFLYKEEIDGIIKYVPEIRRIFKDELLEGKSALLEWSYAYSCDKCKNPIDKEYLVFYEARTI